MGLALLGNTSTSMVRLATDCVVLVESIDIDCEQWYPRG
jgi:hypothetical protein